MADTFTDFVQNLFPSLGQTRQPMLTGTFTDPSAYRMSPEAAAYYADPFRKQNAIQQASLDAALKKKQADEAARRVQGMLSGDVGADSPMLTQSQIDFLENETPAERDARMQNIDKIISFALPAIMNIPSPSLITGLFNLGRQDVTNLSTLNQQAAQERGGWEAAAAAEQMAALNQQAADDLAAWNAYESYNTGDSSGGGMSAADVAAASSDMSSLGNSQGLGSYW